MEAIEFLYLNHKYSSFQSHRHVDPVSSWYKFLQSVCPHTVAYPEWTGKYLFLEGSIFILYLYLEHPIE